MDTVPASVLYLETMETAKTPLSCLPSTRHQPRLGAPVCLFPQRWMATFMQPGNGRIRYGRTPQTTRLCAIPGVLSASQVQGYCSVNRRVPGRYARWCERAAVGHFGSPLPTQLGTVTMLISDFH